MRTIQVLAIGSALALIASSAHGQWPPNGVHVSPLAGDGPRICADGRGGVFIAWRANYPADVMLQRITAEGAVATGWPLNGVPVCVHPESQQLESVVPDGLDGAFVTWYDLRNASAMSHDLYIQRISSSGTVASGWAPNGVPVITAPGTQISSRTLADGAGGAYVTWNDEEVAPRSVYATRLSPVGGVAKGWPERGLKLSGDGWEALNAHPFMADPDGLVVLWFDFRADSSGTVGQRMTPAGGRLWGPNGRHIAMGSGSIRGVVADGSGGGYLATARGTGYFLYRFAAEGSLAPHWPVTGVTVRDAPEARQALYVSSDGLGGTLLAWADYRNYWTEGTASDVYAMRILPDGSRAPGWPANGLRVTNLGGWEEARGIVPDGAGGAYLCYDVIAPGWTTYVQHLTADGEVAAGWPANGRPVSDPPVGEDTGSIVSDEAGGCIVVWHGAGGIRARRFMAGGPVAAAISLASAIVEDGAVRLAWFGPDAAGFPATVERRDGRSEWRALAEVRADGSGRFEHVDRPVAAGDRYAYRLRWREADGEHLTAETWIEVPALSLTLEGLRPNPAVGELSVSFVLPARGPARLELLDVSGRRLIAHELHDLPPGRHRLRLAGAGEVEPGVYWIRLVRGGEQRLARGVVVR